MKDEKIRLPQPNRFIYRVIRYVIFSLVDLYYPRLEVHGYDKVNPNKPAIFVGNHPNGLLDPILIMLAVKRPVSFLAKSTLMGNWFGRLFLGAFAALPVYRLRDAGLVGGPADAENMRALNERVFSICRGLLHSGGAMAIFPEGKTHSESYLAEFKTGAARIALSTEAETDWQIDLQVVPVGLWYENKTIFRSSVLAVIGDPLNVQSYRAAYEADPYQAAKTLTEKLKHDLDEVVLQAENNELLAAIPAVARWIESQFDELPLIDQHALVSEMIEAYAYTQIHRPAELERFSAEARKYARALHTLGIDDPWELELPEATRGRPWRLVAFLIFAAPFALLGALISYLPYRLARPVANRIMGGDPSTLSTFKLILGAVFILITYLVLAVFVGRWFDSGWLGLLAFAIFPSLGYLALLWGERFDEWTTLSSYNVMRLAQADVVQTLKTRREKLADQVRGALEDYRRSFA